MSLAAAGAGGCSAEQAEVLLGFLKKLLVFGGVWFLCFPLLVFSAGFFWHCALAHDRPSFFARI